MTDRDLLLKTGEIHSKGGPRNSYDIEKQKLDEL